MTKPIQFIANTVNQVTEITHNGKSYLVSPVVMISAGVLNSELLTPDEISRYTDSWNGRPVTLDHPQLDGEYVSANSISILDSYLLGNIWNTTYSDNKLKSEIWIDIEKASSLGTNAITIIDNLRANKPIEVSTGYFRDFEPSIGTHNGKPYKGIARNLRSDHLAILPNSKGACSWNDGCGTPRTNKDENINNAMESLSKASLETREHFMENTTSDESVSTNEIELSDRLSKIRQSFRKLFPYTDNGPELDLLSIFDKYLIARNYSEKLTYAYPYKMSNTKGTVTIGEPVKVKTIFQDDSGNDLITANETASQTFIENLVKNITGKTTKEKDNPKMNRSEVIGTLVANCNCKLSEDQLKAMDDDTLLAISDSVSTNTKEEVKPTINSDRTESKTLSDHTHGLDTNNDTDKILSAITALKQEFDALKTNTSEAIADIQAEKKETRERLISSITANVNNAFDKPELEAMSNSSLQKLYRSLAPTDYSGRGLPTTNRINSDEEEVMAMPTIDGSK